MKKCDLEIVDRQRIMGELPRLIKQITAQGNCPPSWKYPDDLIQATLFLIANGGNLIERLVAQDGTLREPKNLFVSEAPLDWFPLWKSHLLPGYHPIHEKYFNRKWLRQYGLQLEKMHQYLANLGVHGFLRDNDRALIKVAGEAIAKKRLNDKGHSIADVSEHDKLGYDLECQGHCRKVFEVKGMGEPEDVILGHSQFTAAADRKRDYVLVCVYNIPTHLDRVGYKEITDPKERWQPIEKARVPKEEWFGK